jgi:4-hydroxy-tetrahydrodipicolinate reductase
MTVERHKVPFQMNYKDNKKIKVIFYGVGAIGSEVAKFGLSRPGLEVVGAIDSDPDKIGLDLGVVLGLEKNLGVKVSGDPTALFSEVEADVVVLTTGSFLPAIYDQLETAVRAGLNVVTSAEELAFPTLQSAQLAEQLDQLAKEKGVTIKAAGINPGFVMDSLIVFLATASADIEHVWAKRVVDCSLRRRQLQMKVGAGLRVDQFKASLGNKIFGHLGLMESAALVADALGMIPDRITQSVEPVIAEGNVESEHVKVKSGDVSGMRQVARCLAKGKECVSLEVLFCVGATEPQDQIVVKGMTNIDVTVKDGIAGDQATVAILINAIAPILEAKPGLLTPTGKSIAEITWRCPVDLGY